MRATKEQVRLSSRCSLEDGPLYALLLLLSDDGRIEQALRLHSLCM
jgi:hypothetical protein